MNVNAETVQTEPEHKNHLQWIPALGAGLIAGLVLLVVPRASPWSSLTVFAPVILGRIVPENAGIAAGVAKALHMGVSLAYGLIISLVVMHVTQLRALVVGGLIGLALYGINYLVVSTQFPVLLGDELSVAFSHLVFGLIAGGAYRGLLRRRLCA